MDFNHECLNPIISIEKPTVDGCEVSNLINTENDVKKRGFMCESFVRPPVDIEFKFSIPINLGLLEIDTEVRNWKCKGISVSIKSEEFNDYILLGKWFTKGEKKIYLKNHNYRHFISFPIPITNHEDDHYNGSLKCSQYGWALKYVLSVKISILCVTPTGPPVLKRVCIWGQPSVSLSKYERRVCLKKWSKRQPVLEIPNTQSFYSSLVEVPTTVKKCPNVDRELHECDTSGAVDSSQEIPEDFLDPLTLEVMVVPILLPSGNTIDKVTLEKFIVNESCWGRLPSDPFTGVPFRGVNPEPNVHLKARIDRFLLLNQDFKKVHSVGQTLASIYEKKNTKSIQQTNQSNHYIPIKSASFASQEFPSTSKMFNSLPKSNTYQSKMTSQVPSDQLETNKSSGGHSLVRSLGLVMKRAASCSTIQPYKVAKPNACDSRGNLRKPSSITQEKFVNGTNFSLDSIVTTSPSCPCGVKQFLYSLTCDHVVCKECLSSIVQTYKCTLCQVETDRKDIAKMHPQSLFAIS